MMIEKQFVNVADKGNVILVDRYRVAAVEQVWADLDYRPEDSQPIGSNVHLLGSGLPLFTRKTPKEVMKLLGIVE